MVAAEVVTRFAAPAARIWDFVRWENMEQYVSAGLFARVVYDERRAIVGATRRLFFHDGPPVHERLEIVAASDYHYAYRLIDSGPLPVTDYVGQVRFPPAGPDACCLKTSSTCSPVGISDAEWVRTYTAIQTALIDHITAQISR